ncbi:dTDP-4-amino-4,6-dideoxygalactose transaminase [Kushneria avicenniae]|uniref:dTDP-4-amino-4,6-dideoxygalactose transaminase n=1 Tax=Kushneria avicenniae TaxID=402385 RepID=A0A1I1LNY9_9GAMM|nr:DegT/DnrJ/EryC1/StrS family aminotransferase [Kushneria avicenniae]SFC72013.1 dTDP-4-amino-4,6-dideoxygalactose transaminase [Kushneria avicenniae]
MFSASFMDLEAQHRRIEHRLKQEMDEVLSSTTFINGPKVDALERQLAERTGVAQCVSCASGSDALVLALRAFNIGAGDRVLCPAHTFAATIEAIIRVGAQPVLIDIDPATFNIDPQALERWFGEHADTSTAREVRAILAVDLFGRPADYTALECVARRFDLHLIADAAQSLGGQYHGRPVGTLADITITSFYPSKPLGGYGDGGALFVKDVALAERLRSLRNHGISACRTRHEEIGMCSRLDALQAAVLLARLTVFDDELDRRERIAGAYREGLGTSLITPELPAGHRSAWAQYTVRLPEIPGEDNVALEARRDAFLTALREREIPVRCYYSPALHHHPAYRSVMHDGLVQTDRVAAGAFSLPMHPYLESCHVEQVCQAVRDVCHDR